MMKLCLTILINESSIWSMDNHSNSTTNIHSAESALIQEPCTFNTFILETLPQGIMNKIMFILLTTTHHVHEYSQLNQDSR